MINGHQKREIERDMKDVLVLSYKIKLPVLRSYRVVFCPVGVALFTTPCTHTNKLGQLSFLSSINRITTTTNQDVPQPFCSEGCRVSFGKASLLSGDNS